LRQSICFLCLLSLCGLAACNASSLGEGLRPTASVGASAPRQEPTADTATSETALAPQDGARTSAFENTPAALPPVSPVAFLPVTGAPQSKVTDLAGSMRAAARKQEVPVVVSLNDGARYQIKGYFSALTDSSGTLLVYVWDVLDANGQRVHRISGQERGGSSPGDPWAAVTPELIERVASSTMSDLRNWMTRASTG
jgi:hypothetical protein